VLNGGSSDALRCPGWRCGAEGSPRRPGKENPMALRWRLRPAKFMAREEAHWVQNLTESSADVRVALAHRRSMPCWQAPADHKVVVYWVASFLLAVRR
jgi:hypothetical protein